MKKKEEFLNTKFSKNYYKEKHINSQYNKKEYKPIIENIISLEKTKIEENTKIPIMTNSLPINIPQIKDQDGIKKLMIEILNYILILIQCMLVVRVLFKICMMTLRFHFSN